MRILLDHNIDWRLKRELPLHEVSSAKEMGWERLTNGQLLSAAEPHFDVMLTVDRNIQHQQSFVGRTISIIVMVARSNARSSLIPLVPLVEETLEKLVPGKLYEVSLE